MKKALLSLCLAAGLLFAALPARAETQTFTNLAPGWNLVTFQVIPNPATPSAVFDTWPQFQAAWTFDAATGNWSRYVKSGNAAKDTLENTLPGSALGSIALGKAYWLFLGPGTPATYQVSGALPANVPGVDFTTGWNMFGVPTGTAAAFPEPVNLLSVLTKAGFDYDTILRWEASSQSYKHYSTTSSRNTTAPVNIPFDPNAGLFANVLVPSQLKPTLVATVRTDVDAEPTGNFPGLEDLNISGGTVTTPKSVADQKKIVFFANEDVQTVSISNLGGGIMLWEAVWTPTDQNSLAQPWLTVATSSTEQVVLNESGAPIRDYKRLNGVTTVENDVIYLRLDRKNLGVGTYRGKLIIRNTAGVDKEYDIEANVPGLQGEWKGFATIETVSGKRNLVPDIDLFVSFYEDAKIAGLMRGGIDSTNALLWPVDVPLIGYRQNNQGNAFQISGSFVLPPGDQNNEPLDVFNRAGNDADWNKDTKINTTNPFPFPIHRHVTLSGGLLSGDPMTGYTITGHYSEVVTGMSAKPIRLEGTFSLIRSKVDPFASRQTKASTDTGVEPVIVKQDASPHTIGAGGSNFANPYKVTVGTEQELRALSLGLNWSTLSQTSLNITLVSPGGQSLVIHNGVALTPDLFKSVTFPENRPTVGDLAAFLASVTTTKGDWLLRIQNTGASSVTLGSWSLRLEGQAVTTVTGKVVRGGVGVANVPVSIAGLPFSQTATTNAQGIFEMRVPVMPLNFTVNSPAYAPANPAVPGLASSFTAPSYPGLTTLEATYASAFQAMPSAPVAGAGVFGYDKGTGAAPFELEVVPSATGAAKISGGPLVAFAPLYADFEAVNPGASLAWNYGGGVPAPDPGYPDRIKFTSPKQYTITLDSPVGGTVEDTRTVVAMPTIRNAPANPADVVAGASTTPYVAYCFQPFFTAGGALPVALINQKIEYVPLPTTAGNNTGPDGALFAELIMLQHTYAANFDLDLAPRLAVPDDFLTKPNNTAIGPDFSTDNFGSFAPSTFVLHPSNDAFSNALNVGYQQEDHNYTLGLGVWLSSQAREPNDNSKPLDLGAHRSYTVEDTLFHPPTRPGDIDDGVTYARYRMTCNIGATLLPAAGLGTQAVQTTAVHANPAARPPLVEGSSGLAKNIYYIMLTGPLAQDWVYQSSQP